jgi:thioredoxin 1
MHNGTYLFFSFWRGFKMLKMSSPVDRMVRMLMLLLLLSTLGCTGSNAKGPDAGTLGPSNSEADLNVALNSGKPVLLEFYAEWCTYCKDQAPILQEIREEYRGQAIVLKIDVDQNPGLLEAMTGQGGLPTILVFDRSGNIVSWWIGYTEKSKITKSLSTL